MKQRPINARPLTTDPPEWLKQAVVERRGSMLKYARYLTRHRENAEDLVTQTILRLFEAGDYLKPDYLDALFNVVMRREFLSGCRLKRRVDSITDEQTERLVAPDDPESAVYCREVIAAIDRLRPDLRQALLWSLDDETHDQISYRIGLAAGTVKSRISRARDALMKELGDVRRKRAYGHGHPPSRSQPA